MAGALVRWSARALGLLRRVACPWRARCSLVVVVLKSFQEPTQNQKAALSPSTEF
jgi:hypothetical protein